MGVSPARAAAFEILTRVETTDAHASELLHADRFAKLSPADHRLATELVLGVLRWRSSLDHQIQELSSQTLAKFDLEVLTALRIGAYQLSSLERIPPHAAINESVELVKAARKRSAAGMVNAVLRTMVRSTENSRPSHAGGKTGSLNALRFPIESSHPEWMVERWRRNYGPEVASKICQYDQYEPHATIRLYDPQLTSDQLRKEGVQLEPGALLAHAAAVRAGAISGTQAFREHRLVIQDEASQLVALLVGKGKRVLDCCAAPGGKTRILAEVNPDSAILAMELHPHRAALLRKLVSVSNLRIIAADVRQMPLAIEFDRVLVDAPCSGTGTLARNPEIKWRLRESDLLRLQAYQRHILQSAMKYVQRGGRLLYSTCSLEPEENEQVIERVLAEERGFRVVECRAELHALFDRGELRWPQIESLVSNSYLRTTQGVHPCDGFFAAILQKS